MKQKLTVITDSKGKVVATQIGHGDVRDPHSGIAGGIVAGPGQNIHKIEFDVPQMTTRADVEAFHKKVAEHLSRGGSGRTRKS
jgi:hypothetical protein